MTIEAIGCQARDFAPEPRSAPRPAATRARRRFPLKRVLIGAGVALFALAASVAAYVGVGLYKIDHAVHHVEIPAALLAKGHDDLLAVVKGPNHTEEIYVFHTVTGHTNVLQIPDKLQIVTPSGQHLPVSGVDLRQPADIIFGLNHLGIPVDRYVGVDLHMVSPTSSLGQLATGKLSVSSLISHPAGSMSLIESVAHHVYLGPNTSPSALLSLTKVPAGHPVSVPTSKDSNGRVVLSATPYVDVLRNFL
jgi:hypothetical protein